MRLSIVIFILLGILGCTDNNYTLSTDLNKNEKLTQYTNATQQNSDRWWRNFNDNNLNILVEKSLKQNLSLLAAKEKIAQSEATLKSINADLYPSLNATFQNQNQRDISQKDEWSRSYSAGAQLDLAIDLWGKLRRQSRSSQYAYLMTKESYRYSALTLAKELTKQYMQLGAYVEKERLLKEQLKIAKNIEVALDTRFNYGKSDYANVLEQKRQIEALKATIISNSANILSVQKSLSLLIAKSPISGVNLKPKLPKAGTIPTTGYSSEILTKRADVHAAYLSLLSANESAAVALLERFPTINLSLGVQSSSLLAGNLFEEWLLNALGSVVAPIFRGGAIGANIAQKRSLAQEAAYTYANTFMSALGDIEEASLREREKKGLLENKKRQVELIDARVKRVLDQYDNGTLSYIDFIGIIQTWQNIRQEYIDYKKSYLNAQIDLYFALGSNIEEKR